MIGPFHQRKLNLPPCLSSLPLPYVLRLAVQPLDHPNRTYDLPQAILTLQHSDADVRPHHTILIFFCYMIFGKPNTFSTPKHTLPKMRSVYLIPEYPHHLLRIKLGISTPDAFDLLWGEAFQRSDLFGRWVGYGHSTEKRDIVSRKGDGVVRVIAALV